MDSKWCTTMKSNQTSKRREYCVKIVLEQACVVRVKSWVEWVRRVTQFCAGVLLRPQLPKGHHWGFNFALICTKASTLSWPSSHHLQLPGVLIKALTSLWSPPRLWHRLGNHCQALPTASHKSRPTHTGALSRPCPSDLLMPISSVHELVPCLATQFRPDYFKVSWRCATIVYALKNPVFQNVLGRPWLRRPQELHLFPPPLPRIPSASFGTCAVGRFLFWSSLLNILYRLDSWSICNSVHKNTFAFNFRPSLGVS